MVCGTESPDHFGTWTSLWAAGIAFVSTLAGGLTSYVEHLREERRQKHEAATRFHNDRLNAYIEFLSVSYKMFSTATVWAEHGFVVPFQEYAAQELLIYTAALFRVQVLCKAKIAVKVGLINKCVSNLLALPGNDFKPWSKDDSLKSLHEFMQAAKAKLEIT